jgi:hypothetical protein
MFYKPAADLAIDVILLLIYRSLSASSEYRACSSVSSTAETSSVIIIIRTIGLVLVMLVSIELLRFISPSYSSYSRI